MRTTRLQAIYLLILYSALAFAITVLWSHGARTEAHGNSRASIVEIAEGRAPTPFVTRRMAVDASRLLARAVPDAVWSHLSGLIQGNSILNHEMEHIGWTPEHYPLLISATAIIWLSVLGFMYVVRAMMNTLYVCPSWIADGMGGLLGISLMGGGGDRHYPWYPYDLPGAFLFSLTLYGIISRQRWMLIAFAAASYGKETAVLLIAIYAILNWRNRDARFWMALSVMSVTYLALRIYVQHAFVTALSSHVEDWWFGRNVKLLAQSAVFDSWFLPLFIVAGLRLVQVWPRFPEKLRSVALLLLILFGIALFRAWFEERRQYLEVISVWGILIVHWLLIELGQGRLLVSRDAEETETRRVVNADREVALASPPGDKNV